MKDASKCWLRVIAACFCLTATAWAQTGRSSGSVSATDESETDGVINLLEDFGSVRIGADPSASLAEPPTEPRQAQYVPPPTVVFDPTAPPMFRESLIPRDAEVGFASMNSIDRMLWRVGRVNMDQYGYRGGYSSIDAFIPLAIEDARSLWFVIPRVNISDYGDGAGSLGIGHRMYVPEDDRIYGVSGWWDFDTGHRRDYHQMGASFESLGRYFDMRFNFTIPIGQNAMEFGVVNGDHSFIGHHIQIQQFYNRESAYQQYDFEGAVPFPVLGRYGFDLGVGTYLLAAQDAKNTAGVSVRTQAQITENFWMNGIYTYDRVFDSNFSLNFELTMPNGAPSRWFRRKAVADQLTASVLRRYRVPVVIEDRVRRVTGIDPDTGLAYEVAHVNPNRTTPGDGTWENPFMSIQQFDTLGFDDKDLFDIVYVRPRNDGTDTNLNTGVTILSGQRLWSSSVSQLLPVQSGGVVTLAPIPLPLPGIDPADPIPLPLLTRSGVIGDGHVVTLQAGGSNFEVSGFDISRGMLLNSANPGGVGSAIFGAGVSNVSIHRNILRDAEYATNLNFSGYLHYSQNVLRDNTIGGLRVEYFDDGQLALFNNVTNNNMGIGFEVIANGATVLANNLPEVLTAPPVVPDVIDDEDADDGGTTTLAFLDPDDPNFLAQIFPFDPNFMYTGISGNLVNLNETGMLLEALNGGQIVAQIEGNTFSNNQNITTAGFVANAEGTGSEIILETFRRNILQANAGSGALLAARDGGTIRTPLQPDPDVAGVFLPGFMGNLFANNNRNGLAVIVENSTLNDLAIGSSDIENPNYVANQFTGNGQSGFAAYLTDATFNDWRIEGSLFDSNERDGIALVMNNSTSNQVVIGSNAITDNGGNGINVIAVNSRIDDLLIEENIIRGNGFGISEYNIDVVFLGGLNPAQQAMFNLAAQRWSQIIVGDVTDVFDPTFGLIDDILITAELANLNPMLLGQATFTDQRADALMLPYRGFMEFNSLYYNNDTSAGFMDTIMHEMAHVIGFNATLWQQRGLLNNTNPADPRFTGALATAEHNALFGVNQNGVPLENTTGNPGSDLTHWLQVDQPGGRNGYENELMTFAASGTPPAPISRVTAAQFADLGYVVNMNSNQITQNFVPASVAAQESEAGFGTPTPQQVAANKQKLAAYYEAARMLPLNDPGVELQQSIGGGGGIQLHLTDSVVNLRMRDNIIEQNAEFNVKLDFNGTSQVDFDGNRQEFVGSGGHGIHIVTRGTAHAIVNLPNVAITGNGGNGIFAQTYDASRLDLRVTSPPDVDFDGLSTISNNVLNGIQIVAESDLPSQNTSIVNLIVDSVVFNGNGSRGIDLHAREQSQFDFQILNSDFRLNGSDGVRSTRSQDAFINGELIGNRFETNGGNGVSLISENAPTVDTYFIQNNIFRGNVDSGIHLRAEADAAMDVTINRNLIEQNGHHGIHVTDHVNSNLDLRYVTGVWTQNIIRNNGFGDPNRLGSGIQLAGAYGESNLNRLQIGLNGTDADGNSLGNIISGNAAYGIRSVNVPNNPNHEPFPVDPGWYIHGKVGGYGFANIANNEITDNGLGGINIALENHTDDILNPPPVLSTTLLGPVSVTMDIDNNLIENNNGIGIEMVTRISTLTANITNNVIFDNRGDGIELATIDAGTSFVDIDDNIIFGNDGRGIDILTAGTSPDAFVDVRNNEINANGGEGVYLVNTSARVQYDFKDDPTPYSLTGPSYGMEVADGTNSGFTNPWVFSPRTVFNMDNNLITNNGELSTFLATGLVIRVGTSNGGFGTSFPGGYASDGFGGVVANVTNNRFSGNYGTDVLFHSFTSTVIPETPTGGTWNEMEFTPMNYVSDPLARLDLVFTGNIGNSADVTRPGGWYDTNEPVFKSRLNNIMPATNAGPFPSTGPAGARRRNAQRLAFRGVNEFGRDYSAPIISPDGGSFLYPGVGTSTFRIAAGTTIGLTGSGADNEFDVLGSTFNTLIGFPGINFFGEEPFGWDTTTYTP